MIEPSISIRSVIDYNNIGCLICNTPKIPPADSNGSSCRLINNANELDTQFGDPLIHPSEYAELILAKQLVERGVPMYISPITNVMLNNDGFNTSYNGYTEFMFLDANGHDLVGYKLKSAIKFCQPILSARKSSNKLYLNIELYLLDRTILKDSRSLVKLPVAQMYKTISLEFKIDNTLTDQKLIDALYEYDLELKIINGFGNSTALVNAIVSYQEINIAKDSFIDYREVLGAHNELDQNKIEYITKYGRYWYKLHSNDYQYSLTSDSAAVNSYKNAITAVSIVSPKPHMLCLSDIKIAKNIYISHSSSSSEYLAAQQLAEATLPVSIDILNTLMMNFTSESGTYIFANLPNVSVETISSIVPGELLDNYNCDLFYGYVFDTVISSLALRTPDRVNYSTAMLSFYSLLLNKTAYLSNNLEQLNISNNCVRLAMSENSAKILASKKCNCIVTFDKGTPSIYGDLSLSSLPNLQYSHISRIFVRYRRWIKEFLDSQKFTLSTLYNQEACINYIKSKLLDEAKQLGVIQDYSIDAYSQNRSVYINISLLFPAAANNLSLEFTI